MIGNRVKMRTAEEKPPVKVRLEITEISDFRWISVLWNVSGRHIGHVGDQAG
jgi:hypothetical protein